MTEQSFDEKFYTCLSNRNDIVNRYEGQDPYYVIYKLIAQLEQHRAVVVALKAFPPKTVNRISPLGDYVTCAYCYRNDDSGFGILESVHYWKALGHRPTCPIALRTNALDALDAKEKKDG